MYSGYKIAKLNYSGVLYYIMFYIGKEKKEIVVNCTHESFGVYCFSSSYESLLKLAGELKGIFKEEIGEELKRSTDNVAQELFAHVRMFFEATNAEKNGGSNLWETYKSKHAGEANIGTFFNGDLNSLMFRAGWYIRNIDTKLKYKKWAQLYGKPDSIKLDDIDYHWYV